MRDGRAGEKGDCTVTESHHSQGCLAARWRGQRHCQCSPPLPPSARESPRCTEPQDRTESESRSAGARGAQRLALRWQGAQALGYSLHSQAPCSQIGPTGAPFAEHFEGSSGKEAGGMLEVDPPTARPLGWVGGSTLRYTPTVTRVKLLNVCVHARPEEEKRRCSMRREHTRQARDPQSNRQHA